MTELQIQIGLTHLYVYVSGPHNGNPVLFLHGPFASARSWDLVISALDKRFLCIAVDFPACGRSPVPARLNWSVDSFLVIVDGLLDALGLPSVSLAGGQMGGSIATWYAVHHPARVERLIVISAGILGESNANLSFYKALANPLTGSIIKRLIPRAVFASLLRSARGPQRPVEPERLDHYFEQFRRRGDSQARIALGVRASFPAARRRLSLLLPSLRIPVLLFFGEADTIVPAGLARQFYRLLPDSRLVTIPGCGDFAQEEFPDLVAAEASVFLGRPTRHSLAHPHALATIRGSALNIRVEDRHHPS